MTGRKQRKPLPHAFRKGNPGGPGRPRKTAAEKQRDRLIRTYAKQEAESFKQACENLLPMSLARAQEILERTGTAREGSHIRLLDILADRVHGRPPIAITGAGGGPILASFTQLLTKVDGANTEKL